jgi:toxin YoeB
MWSFLQIGNYRRFCKPEPLKYKYKGFWSRRIDSEHRLMYQVKDDEIPNAKCRFQYD